MANYYLNDDGSITKKKKNTKGKDYRLNDDGTITQINLPTASKTSKTSDFKTFVNNIEGSDEYKLYMQQEKEKKKIKEQQEKAAKEEKEKDMQKLQGLLTEKYQKSQLPTYSEKPSPFDTSRGVNQNRNVENKINPFDVKKQMENMKNYEKNDEIERIVDKYSEDKGKKLLDTGLSSIQIFGENSLRALEGVFDWAADKTGGISDWVNTKAEKAVGMHKGKSEKEVNKEKNKARQEMIKTDYTGKLMDAVGKEDYKELIESNSLVKEDNLAGQIIGELGKQSVNVLLTHGASKAVLPTENIDKLGKWGQRGVKLFNLATESAPIYTTSYGQALQEAYQNGATQSEARRYAAGSAATETMTEWITSGIPGVKGTKGKGLDKWFEKLIGEELEQPSKTLTKALLKSGYKLVGESSEEVLSDLIDPYLKQFTYEYNSQKDALGNFAEASGKLPTKEDLLRTIIITSITTGILEAPSNISDISGTIKNGKTSNINIDGIAHNNNTIRNNSNANENEAISNENTPSSINMPTPQNVARNDLNVPTQYNQNYNFNEEVNTMENLEAYNERQQTLNNQKMQEELNNSVQGMRQELNEMRQMIPTASTEGMNLQESAARYNMNSNSEALAYTQKLFENRGIQARVDGTLPQFQDSSVAGLWLKDENGNRSFIMNPYASEDTVIENLAIHELTHDLISSENSRNALNTSRIIDYVKTLDGFEEAKRNLIDTYSKQYNPNSANFNSLIEEEIVADVLGKKLGNQEFINRLNQQNKSLARKIYNWVVDKLDTLVNRGGKVRNQRLYWENVKNRFEKAFNMEYNNSTNEASTRPSFTNTGTFDQNEYNRIKEIQLPEAEYANVASIVNSDTSIVPGRNFIELYDYITKQYKNYEIYYKKYDEFKIMSAEPSYDYYSEVENNDTITERYSIGNETARSRQSNSQWDNGKIENRTTAATNDELSNINQESRSSKGNNNQNGRPNNRELDSSFSYDSDGRELSKQQQEFFKDSKARDSQGRLITLYHGTQDYDFNEFMGGTFLTDDYMNADGYAYGERVIEAYANIKNPLVIECNGAKWDKLDTPYGTSTREIASGLDESKYDGIIFKNINDNWIDDEEAGYPGDVYYVPNSNQIKEVDNENPTSNPDIRYSKEAKKWDEFIDKNVKPTGTTGTLMAIHNLNEDKLKGILELGGFPVPSIAITDPNKVNHSQFGNISVLFNKDTIDPSNSKNEVYDRDVWSPTFPQVEYELNEDGIEKVANDLGIEEWRLRDAAEDNSKPEYLIERLLREEKLIDKYINDNNIKYETAYKDAETRVDFHQRGEKIRKFIINNDFDFRKLYKDKKLQQEYFDLIKDYYDNSTLPEAVKENIYNEKITQLKDYVDFQKGAGDLEPVRQLKRYQDDFDLIKSGENKVVDEWQTNKNKKDAAINNGIEDYLREEIKDVYGDKGIRNDREIFTPSGNRRSFWQLHDEYNLENIVDALTKGDTTGTQNWFAGFGQIQANMANRFNSISDIKANENRLTSLAENNTILEEARNNIENDIDEIVARNDTDMGIVSELLADFARGDLTVDNFKQLTRDYYQTTRNVPDSLINKIIDDMNALKNLPTDYFEAKPQRAVGLDEVEALVIPNNTTEEFRKALNDAGIDFVEYDPNVEGDRNRVINKFDNLKFSKNPNGKWQDFVNKHFKSEGTTTKLGNIKLPAKKQVNVPTKQEARTTPVPVKKEINAPTSEKTSMPMVKNDDVLKVASQNIAKQINNTGGFDLKQRSWVETSTESDVLKDKVYIDDLDKGKISYVVQSNKKSLDSANKHLETYGYDKTLDYVKNIMQSDKLPSASDVALMQRMIQEASKRGDAETVQDLIMDTAIVGTDLGQATQALSIIQKLTPEGQLKMYTKLVQRAKARGEKSFQNVEITPEMVQEILEAYDKNGNYDQKDLDARVEKFKQKIAEQMKSTVGEKIDSWRYLSMLGNPKTHIRNLVSNIAMKGTIKVKNAMARTMETVLPVKDRTKTWRRASQDVKNYAKQTANDMKGVITGENKYNEKSAIESKKKIFKSKILEKLSTLNGNALEGEDWLFSKSAFRSTLQEYLTANGIKTQEDIKNNPEIVEKAKLYAVEQAEIATFRQYSKLASTINQIERKNKGARLAIQALVPFKKTPINVAKAGFNYSPLGLSKNLTYDLWQLTHGNMEASQFIDNISQGMTGTSLAILGYALAKAGILTGSGGDDKDDKYDKQLGKTGYSLNIGGKSYSISWLSPVAMPMLVGSNAYEQLEEEKEWDMNVVSDTLAKTLDPLNEMSFMQSLTNALQSYGSGTDKIKGAGESTLQSYVGQFFPTLFSQIAAVSDDKKRSTKASNNSSYKFGEQTVRSVMYKLPGLRQKLEVATDVWGNEKEQSDNIIERAFESFIAPYSKTKDTTTKLDKEIKRVYNETGEGGVIPNIPYGYVRYKNETYRMSANEYTNYKKTYGQNANKYLNNLINSNAYKDADDNMKAKMIDKVYDYARAEANEQYFKDTDVKYSNDELKEIKKLRELNINSKTLPEYIANKTQISSIRNSNAYTTEQKKNQVKDILVNSKLENNQLSYLYGKYYSTEDKLKALSGVNMPIKEFIKYDLTDFTSDYNSRNGKAITGSREKKVINYVKTLNLSPVQKALLIKMEYNSFKGYDNQIVNYVKSSGADYLDKAYLLKRSGFNNYDKEIINYVKQHYSTPNEREEVLKNLGFTVRNGRVYK